MRTRLEFCILGPLEARAGGKLLPLGGPKQRALLAVLLLNANRVVSRDRLIEELVGEQGAATGPHTLRVQVSRLRKTLAMGAGEARVVTRPPGYLLRVEPGELDLQRFEALVAEGRRALARGDAEGAAASLIEAESLWRGRPLADLEFEPFVRIEVERLEELRLAAIEERLDAELGLGREAALVPELEALVAEHPLRERLRAQLMLALYRSGRQADALETYSATRSLLVEELALDPSPRLKDLEQAILRQDDSLELPRATKPAVAVVSPEAAAVAISPERESDRRPATRAQVRRRWLLGSFAAVLAAGAALAGLFEIGGRSAPRRPVIRPGAVALLDSRSGKLLGQVRGGPSMGTVRSGGGAIWDEDETGILLKIDRRTLRLAWSRPVGPTMGEFAVGARGIWMVAAGGTTLLQFDPRYGRAVARIPLPHVSKPRIGPIADSAGVAVGAGSVWVAHGLAQMERIDPGSGRVEHSFALDDASLVAFGSDAVWVVASDTGTLTKIDPRSNEVVATGRIHPWICCLAVGGGYVWASNNERIWKLSSAGEVLRTFETPSQTGNIAYGDGALWVANDAAGSVLRIDAQTDQVNTYRLGHYLTGIGTSGRVVAVSVRPTRSDVLSHLTGRVLRIRMTQDWIDANDPAVAAAPGSNEWPWLQQLLYATCARLLTYRDVSGPAAWRPVPEVAERLPAVSPDGRTYTFTIRPGFRFSPPSGQPVTAATFRYSIERALSPKLGANAPALSVSDDIVGVHAFRTGRSAHISGIRANGNRLSITLVRRAPDFPQRMALSYFCSVPIGTPVVPNGLPDPIPSAGPYYLSGFGGGFGVLKRNPNYHGNRPHRLDAIVFRGQPGAVAAAAAVARGSADYIAEPDSPLAPATALAQRYGRRARGKPRRYFQTPLLATDELAFDTGRGVFANVRFRRAVNLALDRSALARVLGDAVTDRYLPPGVPGYREQQVYPLRGPDLRKARGLARGRAAHVTLDVCSEPSCVEVGEIVKADLERIGVRVDVRRYPGAIASATRRRGADIVLARVFPPYPDPVAALRAAIGSGLALRSVDHLAGAARLAAAQRLELRLLRRQAPVAAFGTPTMPQFFSARVGCKTFQPLFFGVDLAALCLRDA